MPFDPASERRRVQEYWQGPDSEPLRSAEDGIISRGPTSSPRTADAARWQEVAPAALERLATLVHHLAADRVSRDFVAAPRRR